MIPRHPAVLLNLHRLCCLEVLELPWSLRYPCCLGCLEALWGLRYPCCLGCLEVQLIQRSPEVLVILCFRWDLGLLRVRCFP